MTPTYVAIRKTERDSKIDIERKRASTFKVMKETEEGDRQTDSPRTETYICSNESKTDRHKDSELTPISVAMRESVKERERERERERE